MNTFIFSIIFFYKHNLFIYKWKNNLNVLLLKIILFFNIIQNCTPLQSYYESFKSDINKKNTYLYPENEHQNSHNPHNFVKYFELDTSLPYVTCMQCVQLWRFHSKDQKGPLCGPHAPTCEGNACFMSMF